MKRLLFLSVCTCLSLMADAAFAGGGNNVKKFSADWGNGSMAMGLEHALTANNACIGATSNCKEKSMYARDYTDEWGIQMLVAMEVNEKGARFCPVQIEGKNKNKDRAWTEYISAGDNCVWLCKEGFTGVRCQQSISDYGKSCDYTKLETATYSHIKKVKSGTNIEDKVPMFEWNQYQSYQEHDMILAVSRWLPSGHGALVRQMIVRAKRDGWSHMDSWVVVYPAPGAIEILTCKNGYKPNIAGNDCEAIDSSVCAMAQSCSGWNGSDFDENTMVMDFDSTNSCYQYRCRETGYAFDSAINRRCVSCTTNMRGGVSPVDGTCVSCAVGEIYDATAKSSGFCAKATAFGRQEMLYGRGQTKSTNQNVGNQCWPIFDSEEYKKCVVNGGRSVAGASGNGTSANFNGVSGGTGTGSSNGNTSGGSTVNTGGVSGGNSGGSSITLNKNTDIQDIRFGTAVLAL